MEADERIAPWLIGGALVVCKLVTTARILRYAPRSVTTIIWLVRLLHGPQQPPRGNARAHRSRPARHALSDALPKRGRAECATSSGPWISAERHRRCWHRAECANRDTHRAAAVRARVHALAP